MIKIWKSNLGHLFSCYFVIIYLFYKNSWVVISRRKRFEIAKNKCWYMDISVISTTNLRVLGCKFSWREKILKTNDQQMSFKKPFFEWKFKSLLLWLDGSKRTFSRSHSMVKFPKVLWKTLTVVYVIFKVAYSYIS